VADVHNEAGAFPRFDEAQAGFGAVNWSKRSSRFKEVDGCFLKVEAPRAVGGMKFRNVERKFAKGRVGFIASEVE